MPKLCVLMTAKDAAATIRAAVHSTLRAMPRDAELVVLDDGSTDETARLVAGITDRRLRLLRGAPAGGVAAGRIGLLAQTDSEFIAIMDADDIALPWRFRVQLDALAAADIVLAPVVRFSRPPLRVHPGLPAPISARAMPLHLAISCPLAHPTLVARREVVDRIGGYRRVVAEDYDLYLRALTAGYRVARVAVPTLAHRVHAGQVSAGASFRDRVVADLPFQEAVDAFLLAEFGYDRPEADRHLARGLLPEPRLMEILDREIPLRGLGLMQLTLLNRYRAGLGGSS